MALTAHPQSHICCATGCSGPKYSEIVGLKKHSSVVSPRD